MLQEENNRKLPKGDYVTAEEAVLDEGWEIRSRCESVYDVVSKNIIPFDKALKAYEISPEQFLGFLLLNNVQMKLIFDNMLIGLFMKTFLNFVDFSNSTMDDRTKKIVEDMQQLTTSR